jgi:hypothetical protein
MNWIWSRAKHRAANEIDEAALRGDVAGASADLRLVAEAAAELRAAQVAVEPVDPPADLVRQFRAALAPVAASSATAPEKPLSSKRHSPLRPIVVLASAAVIFVGAGGALAATGSLPNALQAPVSDVVGVVGISIPDSNDSLPTGELADPAPSDPAPSDPKPSEDNSGRPLRENPGLDPKVEVEVAAFQDWCVNRGNKLSTKMNLATMSQACTDLVEVADNPAAITAVLTNFKAVCAEVEKFIPKKWMGELMAVSDPPKPRGQNSDLDKTTATTRPSNLGGNGGNGGNGGTRPPTTTTQARTTATTQARTTATTRASTTTTQARTTATTQARTTATTQARTTATTRPPNLGGNGGNGGNGGTRPPTTTTRARVNEDQSQAAEKAARDLKANPEEESD